MKKISFLLFCFVLFAGANVSAQITITTSDLQAFASFGNTLEVGNDTTATSIDIGMTGATSWNFSSLSADFQSTFTSVDPSGTPFAGMFPSATACLSGVTNIMGYELDSWEYVGINNALLFYGTAAQGTISGFEITSVSSNNPAFKAVIVPLTMGTNWTQDYVETDSTSIAGISSTVSVSNVHIENMVDAYGTMTLPGGGTVQALRLRSDERRIVQTADGSNYTRSISYIFITNSGTQVSVNAADTTSPNTGVIAVDGISFIISGVTGVEQADNNVPENFNLEQNYPNPFNPSTQINYSIPSSQKVTLKVYDELGKEVATLVNKDQAAGNYTVDFSASNLASGVYFYRIQAGNFIQMKKMILMK